MNGQAWRMNNMAGQEFHEIELRGCTEEPLINYLKALGIFRIVHKQKDKSVKGYWKNGYFCLKTVLSPEELEKFFLEEFEPSPFFGPWGSRSGFWDESSEKGSRESLERIIASNDKRFGLFKESHNAIKNLNISKGILSKPEKKYKDDYISILRSQMPFPLQEWIDACYVLANENSEVMYLLGTGGNEGSGSYSKSYMECLNYLFIDSDRDTAGKLLYSTISNLFTPFVKNISCGQLDPTTTQMNLINPWDLIFALEGTLLFTGSATKRYNTNASFSFPFTVTPSVAGNASISESKKSEFGKEFWMPIWSLQSGFKEIEFMFSEAKADFGKKVANNGLDFVLAVSSLGVDRGISSFNRYGRLERNGQSNIAIPLGKFKVKRVDKIELLNEFYQWLNSLKIITKDDKTPEKYRRHLRRIEDSIFRFAKYGGASNLQYILIELGKAEQSFSKTGSSQLPPFQSLSPEWIHACDDGSSEYRIACSLASIYNKEIGSIREQLEPIKLNKGFYEWDKRKPVEWNSSNLFVSMINTLKRRLIEQGKHNSGNPLKAQIQVNSQDLIQFLDECMDYTKIADLFFALSTIKWKDFEWDKHSPVQRSMEENLQNYSKHFNVYALLKLVFPDGPYDFVNGKLVVQRNTEKQGDSLFIKTNPEILSLFVTQPGKAIEIASRRLRTHGFVPLGTIRNRGTNIDFELTESTSERILAALLIPIYDYDSLASAVLRIDSTQIIIQAIKDATEVMI
jgi:CRISPR-associated protein Csx17